MAVCIVADDPHVNPVSISNVLLDNGWLGGIEGLWCSPSRRIADVWIGGVGSITVLVDQIPQLLRSEPEDFWCGAVTGSNSGLIEVIKVGSLSLVEVGEVQVHETVSRRLSRAGKDVIDTLIEDDGRILQGGQLSSVILGSDEGTGGAPRERTWKDSSS